MIRLLKSITNLNLFRMDGLVESRRKEYMVEVHKSEHVEEDPAQGCRRYPNPDFETFNDCDMAFMRRGIAASYGAYPSFNPLMVAENESEATSWMEVGSDFYAPKQFNFRDTTCQMERHRQIVHRPVHFTIYRPAFWRRHQETRTILKLC